MKRLLIPIIFCVLCLSSCDWMNRSVDVARMQQQIEVFQKQVDLIQDGENKEKAQKLLSEMQSNLAKLKEDGSVPMWQVLVNLVALPALAIVPKFLPGLGPVAELIANALWALHATKKQKIEDKVANGPS